MTSGTPRGFNLQNMMGFGQNGMSGMASMNIQGAQPFMGMPGGGYAGMQNGAEMGGMHNPGAMRKGGNRFQNRSGPYDRRNNNPRGYLGGGSSFGGSMGGPGMRMASGGMGFVAQGGGGGGGKWGDGAGGGMTMGPREAVQGRSIKSYEDLDAQPNQGPGGGGAAGSGGAGSAELDY